jgi:hypothetical protein
MYIRQWARPPWVIFPALLALTGSLCQFKTLCDYLPGEQGTQNPDGSHNNNPGVWCERSFIGRKGESRAGGRASSYLIFRLRAFIYITYLANDGLNARAKHMQNCIKPVVDPRDDVFGANFLTRSILTLMDFFVQRHLSKTTDTHEYARNANLAMHNITAIQIRKARIVIGLSCVVPGTIPCLAMIFKRGKNKNVKGHILMQKWYIFAWLTRRRMTGMKRTWRSAAMIPEADSANPISEVYIVADDEICNAMVKEGHTENARPPLLKGEKQNNT